jgi:hypothetical protein
MSDTTIATALFHSKTNSSDEAIIHQAEERMRAILQAFDDAFY